MPLNFVQNFRCVITHNQSIYSEEYGIIQTLRVDVVALHGLTSHTARGGSYLLVKSICVCDTLKCLAGDIHCELFALVDS